MLQFVSTNVDVYVLVKHADMPTMTRAEYNINHSEWTSFITEHDYEEEEKTS